MSMKSIYNEVVRESCRPTPGEARDRRALLIRRMARDFNEVEQADQMRKERERGRD